MKKLIILLFIPLVSYGQINEQDLNLPFSDISEYPTEFSQANIVSRMIEGLGYRYYWASKSLSQTDLEYRSSEDARSTLEIIKHIYSLTKMISSSFKNQAYNFSNLIAFFLLIPYNYN
jgi:hypothetical protein